jgi:uncharacterized protein YukJ
MSSQDTYLLAVGTVVEAFSPPEVDEKDAVMSDSVPGDGSGAHSGNCHFNLSIDVNRGKSLQCNINVRSKFGDPDVCYMRIDNLQSEAVLKLIRNVPRGITQLDQGVCFSDIFDVNQMQRLDESAQGDSPGEVSLVKMVEAIIQPAMVGGAGTLYVFGRGYPPGSSLDPVGIDEVHMTEGVTHPSQSQDGALIVSNGDGTYTGLFLAFDSQLSQADSSQ